MFRALVALVGLIWLVAPVRGEDPAQAQETAWTWHDATMADQSPLRYALVLPDAFDPAKTYPVLLAMAAGDQGQASVEKGLSQYWAAEAKRHGWIVVSPISNRASMMLGGAARHAGALIDLLAKEYKIEDGKIHVAGFEAGGRQAFRVALDQPERVASIVAIPGTVDGAQGSVRLPSIRKVKVRVLVGQLDENSIGLARRTVEELVAVGGDAKLFELVGEGANVPSVNGAMLFDLLDGLRPGAAPRDGKLAAKLANLTPEARAIAEQLDDFHDAASKADGERYFKHFADGAVFLGTDATERWTQDEFKAYAEPYFSKGKGWTYVAVDRNVTLSSDRTIAWFDERLEAPHMGECRGSGVMVLVGKTWKIAQYNLTIPVPNDLAKGFVQQIREYKQHPKTKGE